MKRWLRNKILITVVFCIIAGCARASDKPAQPLNPLPSANSSGTITFILTPMSSMSLPENVETTLNKIQGVKVIHHQEANILPDIKRWYMGVMLQYEEQNKEKLMSRVNQAFENCGFEVVENLAVPKWEDVLFRIEQIVKEKRLMIEETRRQYKDAGITTIDYNDGNTITTTEICISLKYNVTVKQTIISCNGQRLRDKTELESFMRYYIEEHKKIGERIRAFIKADTSVPEQDIIDVKNICKELNVKIRD